MRPALSATLAAVLLGGCSLVPLDDVETVVCEEDDNSPCAALNEKEGTDGQCEIYQCAEGGIGCELRPADWDNDGFFASACMGQVSGQDAFDCDDDAVNRAPNVDEAFDAVDNDCDGVIDEQAPMPAAEQVAETLGADVDNVAYTDGDDELIITYAGGATDRAAIHRVAADLTAEGSLLEPDCLGSQGACNVAELSTARAGERLLGALVEFAGCGNGRLRVAELDLTAGQGGVGFPAPACTATSGGIDLDPDENDCTGLSRDGASRGAARVALAGQAEGSQGQALAVWLGDEASRDICGGGPVPLEALGLWADGDAASPSLSASAAGVPLSLGMTTAGSRPAVLSWGQRGYFVAHADGDGAMALQFVDKLDTAAGSCGADNPALIVSGAPAVVGGSAVDHPAMARGKLRRVCGDADTELGIVWQEDCGATGRVVFAHVGYARGDGAGELCVAAGPTVLAEGDTSERRMRPSIAFVERPFVTEAFARPDAQPVDPEDAVVGGFVVAWVQAGDAGDEVIAQRIAAQDGLPVGDAQVLSDVAALSQPTDVHLHTLDGALRATFHAADKSAFFSLSVFSDGEDTSAGGDGDGDGDDGASM